VPAYGRTSPAPIPGATAKLEALRALRPAGTGSAARSASAPDPRARRSNSPGPRIGPAGS